MTSDRNCRDRDALARPGINVSGGQTILVSPPRSDLGRSVVGSERDVAALQDRLRPPRFAVALRAPIRSSVRRPGQLAVLIFARALLPADVQ